MEPASARRQVNVQSTADGLLPVNARFNVLLPFEAAVLHGSADMAFATRGFPNKIGSLTTKIP